MGIIVDIILIAIIAVSAFFAAKKGFIGTLFSLLGTIVAVVLAAVLCTPVSGFIDSQFVNPGVKNFIVGVVDSSSVGKSYEEAIASGNDIADKIEQMPAALKSVLEVAGIDSEKIITSAKTAPSVDSIISEIAAPISGAISKVIALVGLFIVFFVALWVVSKLLTAVFGLLPIGKTLNTTGGLLFGIARGLVIVLVIATLFTAVSKGVDPDSNNIFSNKTIESTFLLKTVSDFNPLASVLNIK